MLFIIFLPMYYSIHFKSSSLLISYMMPWSYKSTVLSHRWHFHKQWHPSHFLSGVLWRILFILYLSCLHCKLFRIRTFHILRPILLETWLELLNSKLWRPEEVIVIIKTGLWPTTQQISSSDFCINPLMVLIEGCYSWMMITTPFFILHFPQFCCIVSASLLHTQSFQHFQQLAHGEILGSILKYTCTLLLWRLHSLLSLITYYTFHFPILYLMCFCQDKIYKENQTLLQIIDLKSSL